MTSFALHKSNFNRKITSGVTTYNWNVLLLIGTAMFLIFRETLFTVEVYIWFIPNVNWNFEITYYVSRPCLNILSQT